MTRRSVSEERRQATDQARRETVEALHRQLAEQVGSLDNRAEWEHYLAFARSFHQYSFGNRLLIMLQAPDATAVAAAPETAPSKRPPRKAKAVAEPAVEPAARPKRGRKAAATTHS